MRKFTEISTDDLDKEILSLVSSRESSLDLGQLNSCLHNQSHIEAEYQDICESATRLVRSGKIDIELYDYNDHVDQFGIRAVKT